MKPKRIGFSRRKREKNSTLGESWSKGSGIRLRTFNGSNNSGAGINLDLFSGSRGGRGQGRDTRSEATLADGWQLAPPVW